MASVSLGRRSAGEEQRVSARETPQPTRLLIIVQNLPVPFDRRVWLECQALISAGYQVAVVAKQIWQLLTMELWYCNARSMGVAA